MTAATVKRPKPEPNPVGRPSDYDPSYCDLVELKMSEGYSLTAFAGFVGVCKTTIKTWAKEHPEFLTAVMRAKAKRMYSWETKGIAAGDKGGGPGASTMIIFTLKNLDRGSGPDLDEPEWADIQRIDQTFKGEVGITEIRRTLVDSRHSIPGGIPANPAKPS